MHLYPDGRMDRQTDRQTSGLGMSNSEMMETYFSVVLLSQSPFPLSRVSRYGSRSAITVENRSDDLDLELLYPCTRTHLVQRYSFFIVRSMLDVFKRRRLGSS